jgi:integrase
VRSRSSAARSAYDAAGAGGYRPRARHRARRSPALCRTLPEPKHAAQLRPRTGRLSRAWCGVRSVSALPAEPHTVAAYLAELAHTDRPATIARKLAAIAVAHRDAGFDSPTSHGMVGRTLTGIRRQKGTAPNQKAALLVNDLRRILAPLTDSLLDVRDRAILLLGFGAALRRSELVGLHVDDLRFEEEGLVVTLRRSKTNPEGRTETIAVAYGSGPTTCPVRAVRRWLAAAGIDEGPVFRGLTPQGGLRDAALGDRMVAHVVKRRCGSCQ